MKRICIFGDSITWGAGLPTRVAWANLLRNYVEQKSDHYIEVYDLGIDGNTTKDLLERFVVETKARNPELIIFAIGVNDSMFRLDGKYDISIGQFEDNLLSLFNLAKVYTDNIWIIGLSKGNDIETKPLKRSLTGKCYTKESVSNYNNALDNFAKVNNIQFVNIYNKLVDSDFEDGLHPNIEGHEKIFESVKELLDSRNVI